jgi:hypothetical protein
LNYLFELKTDAWTEKTAGFAIRITKFYSHPVTETARRRQRGRQQSTAVYSSLQPLTAVDSH